MRQPLHFVTRFMQPMMLCLGAALLAGCVAARPPAPVTKRATPQPPTVTDAKPITQAPSAPKPAEKPAQAQPQQQPQPMPSESGPAIGPGQVVRVAMLVPLGDQRPPVAELARSLVDAARMALSDVNDRQIELKTYDTAGDPNIAAQVATQAVADGAHVILGPLFSQTTAAVRPIAEQAGIRVLSFSTDTAQASENSFLLGILPNDEIARVMSFANRQGITTISALVPQTTYGQVVISGLHAGAARAGLQLAHINRYIQDFTGIEDGVKKYVQQFRTQPTQALLIAESGQALQTLGAYLSYNDVSNRNVKYLGLGGWNHPLTLQETALRGGWFAAPDPRMKQEFATRFNAAHGKAPHDLAGLGYDAMAAIAAMVDDARRSGDAYPFALRRLTDPAGFLGVNGIFRLLPNGQNQRGLAILEVRQGGFTVVDPAPSNFAGLGY